MSAKKPAPAPSKKAPAKAAPAKGAAPAKKGKSLDDAALEKIAGGGGPRRGTVVVGGG